MSLSASNVKVMENKAWQQSLQVGEIPRALYISTEMIAHGTMSCDSG